MREARFEFEGEPPDDGWSKVPHGLWTTPGLSLQARFLLGWLHSHRTEYRRGLSISRIRAELGLGGRTWQRLHELESAGLVEIMRMGAGRPTYVRVNVPAYFALRRTSPPAGQVTSPPAGQVPRPQRATIEDQLEDQKRRSRPELSCPELNPPPDLPDRPPAELEQLMRGLFPNLNKRPRHDRPPTGWEP